MLSGQADHQPLDRVALEKGAEQGEVGGELGAADGVGRTGEAPPGIAQRKADGLGPDVEAGQHAAARQRRKEVGGDGGDHGLKAFTRPRASARMLAQNRA